MVGKGMGGEKKEGIRGEMDRGRRETQRLSGSVV